MCSFSFECIAQKQAYIWYFGQHAGLDFSQFDPVPLLDGQTNSTGGVASVCDSTGRLVFYTDGENIWNSNHNKVNTSALSGDANATQAATIVPDPEIEGRYYVFTTRTFITGDGRNWAGNYYTIDIKPGETGTIIFDYSAASGKPGLLENATEKFIAIPFKNAIGITAYWFLMHEFNSARFLKVKLDGGVWSEPLYQTIGSVHANDSIKDGTNLGAKGQMKANDIGTKVALAVTGGKFFEVFNFNTATGMLSNPIKIPAGDQGGLNDCKHSAYGVEFSPTVTYAYADIPTISNFLYGSTLDWAYLYQWNLAETDPLQLVKTGKVLGNNPAVPGGALQIAPNGKIYFAYDGQNYLGVVNYPNRFKPNCEYEEYGAVLKDNNTGKGGLCQNGLPSKPSFIETNEPFLIEKTCFGDQTSFTVSNQSGITQSTVVFTITRIEGGMNPVTLKPSVGLYEVKYRLPLAGNYRAVLILVRSGQVQRHTRYFSIGALPVVNLAEKDTIPLCQGNYIHLDAGVYSFYEWEDADIKARARNITTGANDPYDYPVEYRVKVSDNHGCLGWDTVWIKKTRNPRIDSTKSISASCGRSDGIAVIYPQGSVTDYEYKWMGFPNVRTNRLEGISGGAYVVSVISKKTLCETIDTIHVNEFPKPIVTITATSNTIYPGQPIQLTAHGAMRYEWINPMGLTSETITVSPVEETRYLVYGINTGLNGSVCMDTASIIIQMKPNGPEWKFKSEDFIYHQMVYPTIILNDQPINVGYGKLGAFRGDQCCGLIVGSEIGPDGQYLFNLQVFGNPPIRDTISFKYWDPILDSVFELFEKIVFAPGETVGTPLEPFVLNGYSQVSASRLLSPGWNWISINTLNKDRSVLNAMKTLNLKDGDLIKGQDSSAFYYKDLGWFGDLSELSPVQMYKIHIASPGYLKGSGYPAIAITNQIPIHLGWNWIGYLPLHPQSVNKALESITPNEGMILESKLFTSTFYDGFGWYGQLTTLEPQEGYLLKADHEGILTYSKDGSSHPFFNWKFKTNTGISQYSVLNPLQYHYSGNITVAVLKDGLNIGSSENELYCFINGKIQGSFKGAEFPPSGSVVYNVMVYSNSEIGDKIQFKFQDKINDQWLAYSESFDFIPEMILGNPLNPIQLTNYSTDNPMNKNPKSNLSVYPNPFTNHIIVSDPDPQITTIELIDMMGRVLFRSERVSGSTKISGSVLEGLVPGPYILRVGEQRKVVTKTASNRIN